MDIESLRTLKQVLNYYDILESIHVDSTANQNLYLGKKLNRCRFCGESFPEVHFENDSHALPEFIGNEYLLSYYECDECNKLFGGTIETDMANFMCVNHIISGVQGKSRKIPKYQRSGVTLNSNGKQIDIRNVDVKKLNDEQFEISLTNPSFTPVAVYKCLTKIALTLLPEEELSNFFDTFKWIREDKNQNSAYNFDSLLCIYSYSKNSFPFITATLFKRRENIQRDIPYIIFRLTYANFSFQTYIPLCSLDQGHSYHNDQLMYIPHLGDVSNGLRNSEKYYIDFNVSNKVTSNSTKLEIMKLDK